MGKLKEKLYKFMMGRYGTDILNKDILWLTIILVLVNLFIRSAIIYILIYALFFISIFRMLSKNVIKRRAENAKYLITRNKVVKFVKLQVNKVKYYKEYKYVTCKQCKAVIRVPRKKGTKNISCPGCGSPITIVIK
ncbi:MAG: hypothetical protein IJB97_10000 [Clostridia bacterium]|nr:hypothetical protein [Clostridia bacterium]